MHSVECDFKSTESRDKLVQILKFFFPNTDFKEEEDKITGKTDLKKFRELSEQQGTSLIMKQLEEKKKIELDKLAMQAGKIALDERGPLGRVTIKE